MVTVGSCAPLSVTSPRRAALVAVRVPGERFATVGAMRTVVEKLPVAAVQVEPPELVARARKK